jgi:hypothetical protein
MMNELSKLTRQHYEKNEAGASLGLESKRCVMLNAIRNVTKTSSYASGAGAATSASSTKPIRIRS